MTSITTPRPQRLLVQVRTVAHCGMEQRHQYEGLFSSTFDAYDDALRRFPLAVRIVTKPVQAAGAAPATNAAEASHAA